jgi:Fe-S-cluster-containing dehydrogenase component/formate-dependent nitrite reductase membrane component NrfD
LSNFGFIIDNRRCIGCHACTVACKSEHNVPIGVNRTWVKYIERGEFPNTERLFSVMRCNHCDNPPCVEICPTAALYRRRDGIVDFDSRRCIGCKACMQACPYDALYIDPESHTAAKCNYCAHRVDQGLEPACVNVCPTQAIISGDLNDPQSRISTLRRELPVVVRREEKGTRPALFYIDGDSNSLDPLATAGSTQTMWGSQDKGVGHYALNNGNGGHVLERLGRILSFGESSEKLAENRVAHHLLSTIAAEPRRAYDAPQKGILWGWQVSGYLWTKSVASGSMMVTALASLISSGLVTGMLELTATMIGLVFLGLTGLLLVLDLDQPRRFAYVLLRPNWRSWLVRGAYLITVYAAMLTVNLISLVIEPNRIMAKWWGMALLLGGLSTAVYTAFLFGQAKGREFWRSKTVPLNMVTHAFLCGASVLGLAAFAWQPVFDEFLRYLLIVTATLHAIVTLIEVSWPQHDAETTRVMASIVGGQYSRLFWLVAMLGGVLIPLLLLFSQSRWMPAASTFSLIGVFAAQHIWVRAPQQVPLS